MRIRYVNPVATGGFDAHFEEQLAGCAGPDVEINVVHLSLPVPADSPFLPQEPFYQGVLYEAMRQAQDDGDDGVVIGCSGDPGLIDARRSLSIPVTAPLDSALHLASQLGQRVVILVADGFKAHVLYRDLARYYGLDHLISEIITVPMEYPDPTLMAQLMRDDPDEASRIILERHAEVLENVAVDLAHGALSRGADVVYPGCTFWTGEMLNGFREALGAPVLDPGISAVVMAVAAARARASQPTATRAS